MRFPKVPNLHSRNYSDPGLYQYTIMLAKILRALPVCGVWITGEG
jgi:hypothetical protein